MLPKFDFLSNFMSSSKIEQQWLLKYETDYTKINMFVSKKSHFMYSDSVVPIPN